MGDLAVVAIKALCGGTMVAMFAVVGHILRPKWFAGLFSAAPAVAIAGLAVTVIEKGHADASLAAYGMLFGVAGFVAFSGIVRPLLGHYNVLVATSAGCVVWLAVAVGGYLLLAR